MICLSKNNSETPATVTPGDSKTVNSSQLDLPESTQLVGNSGLASFVHNEVIKQRRPHLYRKHRLRSCVPEYVSTYRTYRVIDLADSTAYRQRLKSCRTSAYFMISLNDRRVRVGSNACRLRWCPICSRGKQLHITGEIQYWLKRVHRPKFLTLTIQHRNESLKLQIDRLYRSFRLLRRRNFFRDTLKGGIWFFQVTQSKTTGLWHPHLHVILDCPFIPQAYIKRIWYSITQDSSIVDIRPVNDPKEAAEYVARYTARPSTISQLSISSAVELFRAMHKRRISGSFGSAKGVNLSGINKIKDGDWVKTRKFSDIMSSLGFDSIADEIVYCWKTNTPVSQAILDEFMQWRHKIKDKYQFAEFLIDLFDSG